jgi:hypothetical protein
MPGRGQAQHVGRGREYPAHHGGHDVGLEVPHVLVEHGQQFGGVLGAQPGRPQHGPDLAHRLCRGQAVPDDVSDDEAHRARGDGEHVVPVAPDLAFPTRDIPGGELSSPHLAEPLRTECTRSVMPELMPEREPLRPRPAQESNPGGAYFGGSDLA